MVNYENFKLFLKSLNFEHSSSTKFTSPLDYIGENTIEKYIQKSLNIKITFIFIETSETIVFIKKANCEKQLTIKEAQKYIHDIFLSEYNIILNIFLECNPIIKILNNYVY